MLETDQTIASVRFFGGAQVLIKRTTEGGEGQALTQQTETVPVSPPPPTMPPYALPITMEFQPSRSGIPPNTDTEEGIPKVTEVRVDIRA